MSAHEELPSCTDALIWLAEQAAFMVNSGGCACEKIRTTLRAQATERGFSRGSQMNYRLLSEAIEERFGREILQWLGFAAIVDGEPAPWVKRILQENLDGKRRSPAVLFKLVTGTFFESLASFERNIATPQVKQVEVASCQKRSPNLLKLESLCEQGDLTLAEVSRRLGTSRSCIIVGAHRLGVRIPLSTAIKTGLGSHLLATLRGELRDGVPKQEICCRYNCTMWQLAMIELDEPGLYEAHRQAAADRTRAKNRTLLRNYLDFKSQPSRSQIKKELPGVYEYMLRLDSEWFWLQVPSLRHDSNIIKKRQAKDWSELDCETAKRIDSTFEKMLCTQSKPVWATQRAVLSRANFLYKYQNAPKNFPMVTNVLTNRSESRSAFLARKLKWAVTQLKKNGMPISVNQLRRVAGMPSSIVKAHRELVVDLSLRLNAEIGGQSFFFGKRV